MIHDKICTYEVCKLAKVKGFPQDVFGTCEMKSSCYLKDGRYYKDGCIYPIEEAYTAPTQSLLQRWLREEKGIIVEVLSQPTCENERKVCYWWALRMNSNGLEFRVEEQNCEIFEHYEEALESGLLEALKNLPEYGTSDR